MNTSLSTLLERKGTTVFSVRPDVTVTDAVQEMNRNQVGSVLILERLKLVGIFTERDVLTRVVAKGIDPKTTPVGQVMTRGPITVGLDTTVGEVMDIFSERRCRHLPVVGGDSILGLISIGDISRWLADKHRHEAEQLKQYISGEYPT